MSPDDGKGPNRKELRVGDLVRCESTQRYGVVAFVGMIHRDSDDSNRGCDTSVWCAWEDTPEKAKAVFLSLKESDLTPKNILGLDMVSGNTTNFVRCDAHVLVLFERDVLPVFLAPPVKDRIALVLEDL
jgi:hypothetical protein